MKIITRSIRLDLVLDEQIEMIAKYESRNFSNTISYLLKKAVSEYFKSHDNDLEFQEFINQETKP